MSFPILSTMSGGSSRTSDSRETTSVDTPQNRTHRDDGRGSLTSTHRKPLNWGDAVEEEEKQRDLHASQMSTGDVGGLPQVKILFSQANEGGESEWDGMSKRQPISHGNLARAGAIGARATADEGASRAGCSGSKYSGHVQLIKQNVGQQMTQFQKNLVQLRELVSETCWRQNIVIRNMQEMGVEENCKEVVENILYYGIGIDRSEVAVLWARRVPPISHLSGKAGGYNYYSYHSEGSTPRVILATLGSEYERNLVLCVKKKLIAVAPYQQVFIDPDWPLELRAISRQMNALINAMGQSHQFKMKGMKVVPKSAQQKLHHSRKQQPQHEEDQPRQKQEQQQQQEHRHHFQQAAPSRSGNSYQYPQTSRSGYYSQFRQYGEGEELQGSRQGAQASSSSSQWERQRTSHLNDVYKLLEQQISVAQGGGDVGDHMPYTK